jgi:hypothetical protein
MTSRSDRHAADGVVLRLDLSGVLPRPPRYHLQGGQVTGHRTQHGRKRDAELGPPGDTAPEH